MIKSKFRTFRRGVCALLAVLMCLSMASVSAFAASTKTLSDSASGFSFSMESDDTTKTMKSVTVDVKTADEGLHEFTEAANVNNYLDYMSGDNGMSVQINFLDSDGNQVDYSGDVTVSYKLPDDWDLNNGVKVAAVSTQVYTETYSLVYASIIDSYTSGRTLSFTLEFDNTSTDSTRFIIMQNLAAYDVSSLEDGVYDVNLAMYSNVAKEQLSMAAQTVNREAKLIKKDGKVYLNINFNLGEVMFSPAYCNKIYAVDVEKYNNSSMKGAPTYGEEIPGTVLEYYDNEEVRQFAYDTYKYGLVGAVYDYTDEELWESIDSNVLQNGIKAIKNVTLDITNSLQDDGTYFVGFCSDIMDSMYDNGAYGSDNGYNTTNFLIGSPVATDEDADQYLVTSTADKSELESVFEKYINTCDTNNIYRKGYTADSFNEYFVPTWQKVYQAYTYAYATQEQIDAAVAEGNENFEKLEKVKIGDITRYAKTYKGNSQKLLDDVNALDSSLYTTASYESVLSLVPALQEQVDLDTEAYACDAFEAYLALDKAYKYNLVLKATDYTALETTLTESTTDEADLDGYTEESVATYKEAYAAAQAMLAANDSSAADIEEMIAALNEAFANLTEKVRLADGTYTVNVSMVKTDRESSSMANGSINPQAKLEVINGEYYVTLDFKGMTISGSLGYMGSLSYYGEGFTFDEFGTPVGTLVAAEVLSTQKNADGTDVIDSYNSADSLYPDLVRIKLSDATIDDVDGIAPVQVNVPIMASISADLGNQNVLLKLDWSSVTEGYTEPATEPAVTEPTVTEPAVTEPTATEPTATQPSATDPTATKPAASSVMKGDVNGDGMVNIQDVTTIQKYIAQICDLTEEYQLAADTDNSGTVTISDATKVQKYLAQIITTLD